VLEHRGGGGHLADLHRRARLPPGSSGAGESYRSDIDQLLDRRCWLAMSLPGTYSGRDPRPYSASDAASASIAASDAA